METMQIVYVALEKIKPYKNNPRNNTKAVEKVMKSIQAYGFKVPCVLDKIYACLKHGKKCLLNVGAVQYDIAGDIIAYMRKKYNVEVERVKDFKIGGNGIGSRTGEDGEPFLLFEKI